MNDLLKLVTCQLICRLIVPKGTQANQHNQTLSLPDLFSTNKPPTCLLKLSNNVSDLE